MIARKRIGQTATVEIFILNILSLSKIWITNVFGFRFSVFRVMEIGLGLYVPQDLNRPAVLRDLRVDTDIDRYEKYLPEAENSYSKR